MKIVTWNCNSIRSRFHVFDKLVEEQSPDIICIQETKVADEKFPYKQFDEAGYYIKYWGTGPQYGVAIASKKELEVESMIDVADYGQPRHISVKLPQDVVLHNFYVPAGGDEPDVTINPKFDHKMKFITWMTEFFEAKKNAKEKVIVVGDMNIAPLEHDVYNSKKLRNDVSHTDIERKMFLEFLDRAGLSDPYRIDDTESKIYTWWSYKVFQSYQKGYGRRLDHILLSHDIMDKVISTTILPEYRMVEKPTDHCPVILDIDL